MILDQVRSKVSAELNDQADLGVKFRDLADVPKSGPANLGVWFRIRNVTAVFADLNSSTALSTFNNPKDAAIAYTYFIRAMTATLDKFSAKYMAIMLFTHKATSQQLDWLAALPAGTGAR